MDKLSISSAKDYGVPSVAQPSLGTDFLQMPKQFILTIRNGVVTALYKYHTKQKKRYKGIIGSTTLTFEAVAPPELQEVKRPLAISKEILEAVTLKLHAFEMQQEFLNAEIRLSTLAKSLGTNSSYLSKIVNHVKGKSFKGYLNDLRIEYAHEEMKTNPKKRQYTIEAIAFDSGFRSAECFSKKFKSTYGMYPSVYLRDLIR